MSIDFSLDGVPDIPDPSADRPKDRPNKGYQWTEEWWEKDAPASVVRCVGHKKTGERCKHAALNGTTVCAYHGGRAPQVRQRAKVRLEEAANKLAGYLLEMASDKTIPEGVRLAAIRDALDRGGLGVKQAMEIEVSAKPFERVFDKVMAGPREGSSYDENDEGDDVGSLKARLALRASRNEYSDLEN